MQTKALLLKDWLVLSRQMKVFLVLIAVFSAVPVLSVSSFAIVYSAMLPYTAMAFDERDKWDRLAAMMPYRESDLVLSKYLLGYAGLAGVLAVAACSRLLLHRSLRCWRFWRRWRCLCWPFRPPCCSGGVWSAGACCLSF